VMPFRIHWRPETQRSLAWCGPDPSVCRAGFGAVRREELLVEVAFNVEVVVKRAGRFTGVSRVRLELGWICVPARIRLGRLDICRTAGRLKEAWSIGQDDRHASAHLYLAGAGRRVFCRRWANSAQNAPDPAANPRNSHRLATRSDADPRRAIGPISSVTNMDAESA
jgi:hypothetical protein